MPALSPLFFQKLITEMSANERQELESQLELIYGGKPRAYEQLEDFTVCKEQLLLLLNYIVSLNPEKLELFATYAQRVALLTETSAPPDLLITLHSAKTTLENALPAIMSRHNHIDRAALNSFTVTVCYTGANANIENALTENFLDRSSLSVMIHMAKRDLIMQFAKQFLQEKELIENAGNEIHLVNSLFNYVADSCGLSMVEDKFARTFPLETLSEFQEYLEINLDVACLITKISQFLPALPTVDITTREQTEMLDNFLQALGEKAPGSQYSLLYTYDEDSDIPTLKAKPGRDALQSCVIASYLEKASFIQGSEFFVDDFRVICSGLHFINGNGSYTLFNDEELIKILEIPNSPIPSALVLKQISTQALANYYLARHDKDSGKEIIYILCRRILSSRILKKLHHDIVSYPHAEKGQDIAQLIFYNYKQMDFSKDEYIYLATLIENDKLEAILRFAIRTDSSNLVDFLIEYRGNILSFAQITNLAVAHNAINVLKLLHRKNVDLNQIVFAGLPICHLALKHRRLNLLPVFKELNVDLNQKAGMGTDTPTANRGQALVHMAASTKNTALLQVLKGLDANPYEKSATGETVISTAIQKGDIDFLTELAGLGIDFTSPEACIEGIPLANYAIRKESDETPKILETLKGLGVSMNEMDLEGLTPVHLAAMSGNAAILRKLHELGADFKKPNRNGLLPLAYTVTTGAPATLMAFNEFDDVDFNEQDSAGNTALHHAVSKGLRNFVRTLSSLSVNPDIQNAKGETPAFIAAAKGRKNVLSQLKRMGANFNIPNAEGKTPVYAAVINGHLPCIDALMKYGVDLSQIHLNAEKLFRLVTQDKQGGSMLIRLLKMGVYFVVDSDSLKKSMRTILGTKARDSIILELIKSQNPLILETALLYLKSKERTITNLLLFAAQHARSEAIFSLVQDYAPDFDSENGDTLMHGAAQYGNLVTFNILLNAGHSMTSLNNHGETPAFLAALNGQYKMLELLKVYDAANQPVRIELEHLNQLIAGKSKVIKHRAAFKIGRLSTPEDKTGITLCPKDVAEIMGHQEIVLLLNSKQPATPKKPVKLHFFAKMPEAQQPAVVAADAMDVDIIPGAINPAPVNEPVLDKPAGKRGYISIFLNTGSAKRPKNGTDENGQNTMLNYIQN